MSEMADHQLSAYLDGALGQPQRREVEAALASDPDVSRRLDEMRRADLAVREAFDLQEFKVVPPRFAAMIDSLRDREEQARVIDLRSFARITPEWRVPLAAGLALAIGAGGGFLAGGSQKVPLNIASMEASPMVQRALESTPSAQVASLGKAGEIEPVLSFRAGDGRYCREIEIRSTTAAAAAGVACRSDGGWTMEVLVATGEAGPSSGYAPVGDHTAPAIEELVARLGAGAALSGDQERAAIDSRWR